MRRTRPRYEAAVALRLELTRVDSISKCDKYSLQTIGPLYLVSGRWSLWARINLCNSIMSATGRPEERLALLSISNTLNAGIPLVQGNLMTSMVLSVI